MNPSSSGYSWNNPPPPGTEYDSPAEDSNFSSFKNESIQSTEHVNDIFESSVQIPVQSNRDDINSLETTRVRSRSKSSERHRHRRRSRSYSRYSKRSRTRSRDRRRRSRSRSRRRHRKYSSHSRSRSRSPSYRHRRRKHGRRRSRSRSRNHRSRSRSYSRSYRNDRDRQKHAKSPRVKKEPSVDSNSEKYIDGDLLGEEDMKIEEPDEESEQNLEPEYDTNPIPFKNDGSFLEMFKKMQEMQKVKEEPPEQQEVKKPILPAFGKRRGGKVLKTGMVAKVRNMEEESGNAQDAWAIYMKEVRKYKEVHCDDDSKTRPLVK